jgi:vacuolar-type H+-ATPase subunit E/Vma4
MQQALLDMMASQVARQCEEKLTEARRDAGAAVAEARERAEQRRARALERERAEVERLNQRARELAQVLAEHEALTMQQAVADEVLAKAEIELARLVRTADFPGILEGLLAELIAEVSGDGVVLAPAARVETCRAWLARHSRADVVVQTDPNLVDGVAYQDARRTYRITNAMSSRLHMLQNEARKTCLDALFPKGTHV